MNLPFSKDFQLFLGSSFVVAVFVLIIMVGSGLWLVSYLYNGKMTFTIQNCTNADISNVRLTALNFDVQTGKMPPGDSRVYKYQCGGDTSPALEITFPSGKTYRLDDLYYLDGVETNCVFLLKEDQLVVRGESTYPLLGKQEDGATSIKSGSGQTFAYEKPKLIENGE